MISSILLLIPIALAADAPTAVPNDRDAYQSAAAVAAAGKDAGAHVRLALWCEAHGMSAERLEQLSRAVVNQPSNALARGLLGLVRYRESWERPEDVATSVRDDQSQQAVIREYLERRVRTPETPDDQMKLADWCAKHRLKDQATAHYRAVVRLDPSRAAAWKPLGYRKQGTRWIKPDELAGQKQEALRQKQADRHWRPKLEKLRKDLQSRDPARRAKAEQSLTDVTDPRAVPTVWAVLVTGGVRHQMAAIQMFGQIEGPSASNALAVLALFNPRDEVRARAAEALERRDPRDVVGRLIGMIHKPFQYEVRPGRAPGSPGELYVEGERYNIHRLYQNPDSGLAMMASAGRLFSPDVPFDPFSIQNMLMASGAWASSLLQITPKGLEPTGLAPIDPSAVNQAMQAMAAHPQNAAAILNQLQNNPNNRDVPLGYTFRPTDPSYQIPVHLSPHTEQALSPMGPPTPAQIQALNAFARQVQAQANNPLSPMGMAIHLGQLENNPAHLQGNAALTMTLPAQQMAAQRDLQIGYELARIQQNNQNLRQKLAMDVQFLDWTNLGIKQTNARVLPVLKAVTGLELGIDRTKWQNWWLDQLDLDSNASDSAAKPTYREYVNGATGASGSESLSPAKPPSRTDPATGPVSGVAIRACFAAGTVVQTVEGSRPVESLQVGDRVLSEDPATGELEYQPVLAVHRNKPAPTLRIAVGGESVVASDLQPFWKAGKGWTMARDLEAGDRLRIIGGVAEVTSVAKAGKQPVYNIDVAENRDLFVGAGRVLVHDFGFVPAVPEPFDRPGELTSKAAPVRPSPSPSTRSGPHR